MTAPCKDCPKRQVGCPKRQVGCHGSCEEYQAFRAERAAQYERRVDALERSWARSDALTRLDKIRRHDRRR